MTPENISMEVFFVHLQPKEDQSSVTRLAMSGAVNAHTDGSVFIYKSHLSHLEISSCQADDLLDYERKQPCLQATEYYYTSFTFILKALAQYM